MKFVDIVGAQAASTSAGAAVSLSCCQGKKSVQLTLLMVRELGTDGSECAASKILYVVRGASAVWLTYVGTKWKNSSKRSLLNIQGLIDQSTASIFGQSVF